MTALQKVVSGGQTGIDRAALDASQRLGLETGGWCPRGRLAEDGPIDLRYPLRETPSDQYAERTRFNVRDSDGTLILHRGQSSGGTALTARLARGLGRPCLEIDLNNAPAPSQVAAWIALHEMTVLNVAGPRQSEAPGIYRQALRYLLEALRPAGASK